MALLMTLTTIGTGVNILLILGLLAIYWKNYSRARSQFTTGLLIFGMLFLVQNIIAFYHLITMMPYFVDGVEKYAFSFTILQALGFATLNWVTWK